MVCLFAKLDYVNLTLFSYIEESITDFKEISDYLNSVKDNLIYRYKLPNEVNIPE